MIVGIDEVGRGCWAGPLVAGAVLLKEPIPGLKDSKKLSKLQRERLAEIIQAEALAIGLGWVWPGFIDKYGLTESVRAAMDAALRQIEFSYTDVVIDGNINYLPDHPMTREVIKADDTVPAVSAASIMAKVARDTYMATTAAGQYPAYGFDKHVGYGTALHLASLAKYGVTPIHRLSFKPVKRIAGI